MRAGGVEVRIEELVLRGFSPEARHRIGDAFEGELGRLFAGRGGWPEAGGRIPRVDAGGFPADLRAEEIGARVARKVYDEVCGPRG